MKKTCCYLFKLRTLLLFGAVSFMTIASAPALLAQQKTEGAAGGPPPPAAADASSGKVAVPDRDDRYRIGPGDVLDIRVFNRPQLSREAVRVDARGMIQMPLLEGDIQAACKTEEELAKEIATRYLKYQRNPYVNVFVKDFQSTPVAVVGAVDKPGRFQLQRRVRLAELVAFAGGPTDKAGQRVQVARTGGQSLCESRGITSPSDSDNEEFLSFNLIDTLRGAENSNPYMRPGDIVTIPEAEQAFVVGNVFKPAVIPLKEPTTVAQAVAMAGGALRDSKTDKVRILRQIPNSPNKTEIIVNLSAISKRQAEDVVLRGGDIVDVPTSTGKRIMSSILGAISPAAANLPVYILR
ncbi:MAG TPA: polysaccharide biosynthesis/export family protein [Pyrinomonadaceae bacterium]|nr:polysaccharide biosynthesis/export family protein [Pyrinomonadaceae bacterium]